MDGELAQVTILAFKDKTYQNEVGRFKLPINPEGLTQLFETSYDRRQPGGAQGGNPLFKVIKPETLSLKFTLDGTGVVPVKGKPNTFHKDVAEQVKALLNLVYDMNGQTHRPNFLRLLWGEGAFGAVGSFDCILGKLNINYTLFAPNGKPLRAKLDADFIQYAEPKKRSRRQRKGSPDITHVCTVRARETLPLLTQRIYGDQSYYLQVAKANGLINFRQLKTSTHLRFPPIDKTSL